MIGSARWLLAVSTAALAAGSVHAADMPLKAPAAMAVPAWQGFYLGGHVGYAFSTIGVTSPSALLNLAIGGVGATFTDFVGAGAAGVTGGGLVGYNWRWSPRVVAGLEADVTFSDLQSKGNTPFDQFFGGVGWQSVTLAAKQDWHASLRARLGYLVSPETLVFATAGWGWSRVKFDYNQFMPTFAPNAIVATASENVHGPVLGAGIETVIAPNWTLRAEYLHTFYNRVGFSFPDVLSAVPNTATLRPNVGNARVALAYQFGNPHSAVAWTDARVAPSWTGLYIGATAGVGMGNVKVSGVTIPNPGTVYAASVDGLGVTIVLPTLLAGYNVRFSERLVAGLEVEGTPAISASDIDVSWGFMARGRLGYLVTPATLVYASAGWGSLSFDGISFQDGTGSRLAVGSHTFSGFQLGGGIEGALTQNWSWRFDYQYSFYNSFDVVMTSVQSGGTTGNVHIDPSGHAARLGIVYRIGG